MQATIVKMILTMIICMYVYNAHGITIGPNQIYWCTAKNPSLREKTLVVRGEHSLPSTERVVEIFTHKDDEGCKIYWSQMTQKEPRMNNTNSTTHGKGTRRSIIMG